MGGRAGCGFHKQHRPDSAKFADQHYNNSDDHDDIAKFSAIDNSVQLDASDQRPEHDQHAVRFQQSDEPLGFNDYPKHQRSCRNTEQYRILDGDPIGAK